MSWSTINNNRDTKALDRDGNPSIRVIETEEQNSNKINLSLEDTTSKHCW